MITTTDTAVLSDHKTIYGSIEWTLVVGPADSATITMARDLRCGPSVKDAQVEAHHELARLGLRATWIGKSGTLHPAT